MMLLISTLGYSQFQQSRLQNEPVKSAPATMDQKNSTEYPITKIYNGDTVVIMTLQQGKDMNKRFVLLKDSLRYQRKYIDTLNRNNSFLAEYLDVLRIKNSELAGINDDYKEKLFTYKDSILNMGRRADFEALKFHMFKSESEMKMELLKSQLENKFDFLNAQLASEKERSNIRARHSAIFGGLIVGGVAITGAMIIGWMPSTWFK